MKRSLFSLLSRTSLAALLAVAGHVHAGGSASFVFHVGTPHAAIHSGPVVHYRHAAPVVVYHRAPPHHPPHHPPHRSPHVRQGPSHVWVPGHWAPVRPGADARRPHGPYGPHSRPNEARAPLPSPAGRYPPPQGRYDSYRYPSQYNRR